jgi:hypothetical protein
VALTSRGEIVRAADNVAALADLNACSRHL